jgi:hypothetical protein
LPLVDEDLLNNETMYPPDEVLNRLEFMHDVGTATALYNRIWNEIKSY